jgi:DNA-3-methyladenine glycosylase
MNIKIKRVYEPADRKDGERILVDRLWPRGLTKEKARVDLWL